jgi:drug/metabolite transporter (DMT)-like permease
MLAAAAISLKAIFVKLAYLAAPVDAITLLTLRMGLVLPAFLWMARGGSLRPRHWAGLLATGFLGFYLSSLFDFIGLHYISSGLERLILFTYPPIVMLIESLWDRRPLGRKAWLGMGIAYAGLILAMGGDLRQAGDRAAILAGAGWVLLCSLCFAAYSLGSGRLVGVIGARRLAGMAGTVATLFIFGHFLAIHHVSELYTLPPALWKWSAAMALVSTLLPIWLTARAMAQIGAGATSAIGTIGPALTIGFSWVILGEPFSWLQLAGLALVIGGVWKVGRK